MPNSTILANGNNYNKYMKCILTSRYIYGAAYNIHAPTPPKSFHPSVKKIHKWEDGKHRGIKWKKK